MLLLIAIDIDHRNRNNRRKRGKAIKVTKFSEVFDAGMITNQPYLLKALIKIQHANPSSEIQSFHWTPFQLLIKESRIPVITVTITCNVFFKINNV